MEAIDFFAWLVVIASVRLNSTIILCVFLLVFVIIESSGAENETNHNNWEFFFIFFLNIHFTHFTMRFGDFRCDFNMHWTSTINN